MRTWAAALLVLASCQTKRQATIVAISAGGIGAVGGYAEYRARSDGGAFVDNIPATLVFGGIVAAASVASLFFLDEFPRLGDGHERWRPSTYRAGSELLAGLQRTSCLGRCPVYNLAIYRDGTVEFDGRANVIVCGRASTKLPAQSVRALEQRLLETQLTAMGRAYDGYDFTDAPSAYVWFRPSGGPTKGIAHYLGDHSAPEALRNAEAAIDAAANVQRWIGEHRYGGGLTLSCP